MPLTHSDEIVRRTAKAAFWQNFESFPSIMDGVAMRVTSDADQEIYPWFNYAPGVRQMVGGRNVRSVPATSWTIVNKKWENTVAIDYVTRRFNKIGSVPALLGDLGRKARAYPDKLTSSLINTGHSTACYDTQFFYDTDHTDVGAAYTTSQDNDKTSAITAAATPTDIEFANAVRGAIDAMFGYKDGDGDPVMPDPNTQMLCMVPPGYKSIAERVETVDQLTGPVGNDLKGKFRTVVNPWLDAPATTAAFFMFNPSGARKSMIYQVADDVQLEDNMGGDNEFQTKDVHFGSFAFYNVGYGDWRYSVRHLFTTA